MSFVTSEKMLLDAQKGGYAVGAFNVENMEMVMAVIAAAEELRAPLMMQTTPSTIKYAGLDMYLANVKAAAEKASVPVCLHLDHGDSFEIRKVVSIPLVLHGASGLSEEAVVESIKRGICKVNFATELRIAYTDGVKEFLAANPDAFDPKKYGKVAMEKVKEIVKLRMTMCGCAGKV